MQTYTYIPMNQDGKYGKPVTLNRYDAAPTPATIPTAEPDYLGDRNAAIEKRETRIRETATWQRDHMVDTVKLAEEGKVFDPDYVYVKDYQPKPVRSHLANVVVGNPDSAYFDNPHANKIREKITREYYQLTPKSVKPLWPIVTEILATWLTSGNKELCDHVAYHETLRHYPYNKEEGKEAIAAGWQIAQRKRIREASLNGAMALVTLAQATKK